MRDSIDPVTGNPVREPATGLVIRVPVIIDTLYDIGSIQSMHLPDPSGTGTGETFWTINCMILRDSAARTWLATAVNADRTEKNVYRLIDQGKD